MAVIEYVHIENFRSIRQLTLGGLEDYSPLLGLNSSGKSNVLRALNLFFNGYVDEERRPLNFVDDLSDYAPKGKKKVVSVTVGIGLSDDLHVRGQDEFQRLNGISDRIYIRRIWTLGPDKLTVVDSYEFGAEWDDLTAPDAEQLAAVLTHVRAVRFVYIPNHILPAQLIRSELEPLRPNLVARLRGSRVYRESSVDDLFAELAKMGERLFGDLSSALERGVPGLGVTPDLPATFADLIFTLGLQAVNGGTTARSPEFEGSGAQAFILLHVLDLADRTRRAGGFGWVQASVWAFEEPESFLHAGLRARFSEDLRQYAQDGHRQVLTTTHQDEFVRVADAAWYTKKGPTGTAVSRLSAREALAMSTREAVTAFNHPLFIYTDQPLLIVEGKWDEFYLRSTLERMNLRPRWRLISPMEAFGQEVSGDAISQYLKYNRQVIASRPDAAPVIVLRDWEATNKQNYDNILSVHPYSECLIAPAALVNPDLEESFVGIERYLETETIASVVPAGLIGRESGLPESRLTIKRQDLESFKGRLASAIESSGQGGGKYLEQLVGWVDSSIADILSKVPAAAFLR